ncbi:hypothetical protein DSM107010_65070 [Chroococcidiopsis cubana SAG 39.79]|uniref:Uncharacterized protein n=1 Tax=Chroococcidiopsis cubana SAG 39.79 TaxID=388085 RepID=A0AB37U9E9_9CYAN|nr:hypothetical protein [Chroococcidiopsis cubana]RUT01663.1 hypothetical protein DSM107010_65070 [Chroococcidiopsis cubana SAG 39.79]
MSRGFLLPSSFICEVVLATGVDMDVGYFATQNELVAIADDECKKIRVTGNFVSGLGILQELLL